MELHLEFHPHRFITRFNAIQKELEAREVVYIEDDDDEGEEEEEGEGEGIQGEFGLPELHVLLLMSRRRGRNGYASVARPVTPT